MATIQVITLINLRNHLPISSKSAEVYKETIKRMKDPKRESQRKPRKNSHSSESK
jgi:hypothetical protein